MPDEVKSYFKRHIKWVNMEQQAEKKTTDIEKEEGLTMIKVEEYGRGCSVVLQKPD